MAVLRLAQRDCSPRTRGAQPAAVLRLAQRAQPILGEASEGAVEAPSD